MFLWSVLPGALLALFSQLAMPESPRFLAQKGMAPAAEASAFKLWGRTEQAAEELQGILTEAKVTAAEAQSTSRTSSVFETKYRKVLVMCVMMFVFQQMSGVNSIVFFSSNVFRQVGIQSTALASLAVGVVNMAGTVLSGFLVERAGRVKLMQCSYGGMTVSLATMATSSVLAAQQGAAQWMPLVVLASVIAYMLAFSIGAGAIPGIYVNEISPTQVRGEAGSVAFTTHWIMNILIGQTFLQLVERFGVTAVYAIFFLSCCGALVFLKKEGVETKGKSGAEVYKAFVSS